LVTAALLIGAELLSKRRVQKKSEGASWLVALLIGLLQAVALVPGVSRSGAALSGALSRGLDRDFAARFSFLLSIPVILGALVLQLRELAKGRADMAADGTVALITGTMSAAIVGFFAVRFMLKIVRERSLYLFAVYTAALGTLVLIDQFVTHFVF
jgi:undecaprenyl-diphosphatase